MVCNKPKELKKYSKDLDKVGSFEDFLEIDEVIDDICYDIATCKHICGNKYCQGLQETL